MRIIYVIATVMFMAATGSAGAAPKWDEVDHVFDRKAAVSGDVHRFAFPRSDLEVTLDGVSVKPGLALGSWVAFREMGDEAMVMGDLVLTEEEVKPVMTRLVRGGVAVTALHNHLLGAKPATMYLHIDGHGDPLMMARAIRVALEQSRTPIVVKPPAGEPPAITFDTGAVDRIMGFHGKADGGIYKFSIPRTDSISAHGHDVPEAMGSAIAIGFQPTNDGKAATTGDFVLAEAEIEPVIRALTDHDIEVTALHNHMLDDEPRLFFMHFWGHDDADKLARGLRAALDEVHVAVAQQ